MKTYILNSINRLKSYSQKLDAESTLYSKSWEVFNDAGNKELFIFRPNNELLISRNGIVQRGKWDLLDVANIIIDVGEKTFLLNAAYIEDKFLALKLDGTNEYMVMIETDMKDRFSLNTIGSIEKYLEDRYKKIEAERIDKEIQKQKLLKAEKIDWEQIRLQKEKEEREKWEQQRKKDLERLEYLKNKVKKGSKIYLIWFIVSTVLVISTVVGMIIRKGDLILPPFIFLVCIGFYFFALMSYSNVRDYKNEYEELSAKINKPTNEQTKESN